MPSAPNDELEIYYVSDGDRSVAHFVDQLPPSMQQEAEALIRFVKDSRGQIDGGRLVDHGDGISELKGANVRIFYKFSSNNRLILLEALLASETRSLGKIRRKAELL